MARIPCKPVSDGLRFDIFGNLAGEYSTEADTTQDGTYYMTADHLGTVRVITGATGAPPSHFHSVSDIATKP